MPNFLVYAEIRDGRPTEPSLFALAEARRVARDAGASTFAIVAGPPLALAAQEAIATPIAEAGADKLLLCEDEAFAAPPLDAVHGRALDAAIARVPPLLILFPAGGAGVALGPPLAARLGGAFAPCADLHVSAADAPGTADGGGGGRVHVVRLQPDGGQRRIDPIEIERPIVATLGAGRRPPRSGRLDDLEIEIVACAPDAAARAAARLDERRRAASPWAALELAPVIVLVGDGDGAAPFTAATDALAAAAPAGVVVVRATDVPASVLAACCPDVLVKLGPTTATTGRTPRTRVVAIELGPARDDAAADIFWQVERLDQIAPDALAVLLATIGAGA